MRLFIAIEVPEKIGVYLAELQKEIGTNTAKIRWVNADSMHLTLKFLGEVQPSITDKVKNKLKKVKVQAFTVYLDSIGVFPNENYTRVVWIGLKPEEEVNSLQREIDEKLEDWFKEEKNFKPHITLGRVKYVEDKKKFTDKLREIKVGNKKFEVSGFRLIKSTLTREGPVYETVESFK